MEVAYTKENPLDGNSFYRVITWADLANGDTGLPITLPQLADRSVQVVGTFGGGSITIEGTIDGTNYATLTDPQGNALVLTTAKIETITEIVRAIRPVAAGDGTTDLTVSLLMRLP